MEIIIKMRLAWLRMRKILSMMLDREFFKLFWYRVAPTIEHEDVIRPLVIDGVIDVGANRGQFTKMCRTAHPGIPVVAFEPNPSEARIFRALHCACSDVELIECALGESMGTAMLHLSRRADSSSLLPIGLRQTEIFKSTEEVGCIEVPVSPLDDFSARWSGRREQLLKLDVQGFELSVLRGAVETLRSCNYVYAECSEISLYVGQALRPEIDAFLMECGFLCQSRHNEQWDGRQLVQADYLYSRRRQVSEFAERIEVDRCDVLKQ